MKSSLKKFLTALLASVLVTVSFARTCAAQAGAGETVALFLVFKNSKCGFADRAGRWVIAPRFQSCNPFEGGMAEVWLDNRRVYVDASGRLIEDRNFASNHFSEGLIPVHVGEKYGFADTEGRLVIFPSFDDASDFSEGLAPVESGGKWGYVDRSGALRIAPRFDEARSFSEGLASVCLYEGEPPKRPSDPNQVLGEGVFAELLKGPKKRCGYVERTGEFRIEPRFGDADSFSEGLARVCVGRCAHVETPGEESEWPVWGYVDKSGAMVIAARFRAAGNFSEGLAAVKVGKKQGFIDKSGAVVIPPRFEWAMGFEGGLALVALGETKYYWPYKGITVLGIGLKGRHGYIDRTGEFVSDKLTWKGKWKK